MSRIAFDTNILAYIAGVGRHPDDAGKIEQSRALLKGLQGRATLIAPVQVLGELFVVLTRAGSTRDDARATVLAVHQAFGIAETSSSAFLSALDLASAHKVQLWDALIVNAAAEAGCALLLTEDMQSGFDWRGLTVVNPLDELLEPRLARLIGASAQTRAYRRGKDASGDASRRERTRGA